jgi:hypothetical protein
MHHHTQRIFKRGLCFLLGLVMNRDFPDHDPPTLASSVAEITRVCHHTSPRIIVFAIIFYITYIHF